MRTARGFTLVELTTVLVLAGILSAFAMARFVPASTFAPNDAVRAIVAGGRLGQRAAMARTNGEARLEVQRTSDALRVDVRFADALGESLLSSIVIDHGRLAVRVDAGALGHTLAAGEALVLRFDSQGGVASVTAAGIAGSPGSGVAVRLTGDVAVDLCVAASGYVQRGTCS